MSASKTRVRLKNDLEETITGNHFGHFLLTHLLLDSVENSAPARIINVSSMAHWWGNIDVDNLNYEKGNYSKFRAYGNSKLANILFTVEMSNRMRGKGVTVNCLHPGLVNTNIFRRAPPLLLTVLDFTVKPFIKTSLECAQTTIFLATSPLVDHVTGHYFSDCRIASTKLEAVDQQLARQLWEKSSILTK